MRAVLYAGWAVLCAGCAMSMTASPPATAAQAGDSPDARAELRHLEGRIAAARAELGLPLVGEGAGPGEAGTPPGAPPAQVAAEPPRATGAGRCAGVCQASADICGAAERICRISAQLGDAAAARSCTGARASCEDGQRLCRGCR